MLELTTQDILLGKHASNKEEAIKHIATDLVSKGLVADGYEHGMLAREQQNSTFLGNGIAIPHGTTDTRDLVKQTGVQIHHFANGVDWGDGNTAFLAIGIAAKSGEHLGILKQLTHVLSSDGVEESLKNAKSAEQVLAILTGENQQTLLFDEACITLHFPVTDLTSMSAVCAGKLKNARAVNHEFVADLVAKAPTHIGQGMWVTSSSKGVNQTALSLVTVESEFHQDGHPVKGLLTVAGKGAEYIDALNNVTHLLASNKLVDVFNASAADAVKMLLEARQSGLSATYKIKNAHGLHARPGALLVSVAKTFDSQIWVTNVTAEGKQVNAKSLMKVIALGVKQGHELAFVAEGTDAQQALDAIGIAISNGLGEG
ncbi:fused PTS fructose transporter subunit IIA/HPr protein [Enterovibrio norvegicus]|uniref:fused PTS fructose transporter subunit IIA/HPr protein n=1 Tax=Enterovibrio norvegicus TaxID=188144 RepID=UPI00352CD5F3